MKILLSKYCDAGYRVAAVEFADLYYKITGIRLSIDNCDDKSEDVVIIGSDAVNSLAADLVLSKQIESFPIRYSTDDYCIKSFNDGTRNILILAGGRARSTIYAVYDFFEIKGNCKYFWDGDIIPKKDTIDITGLDVVKSPRFEYRGIRYFAHRGLHRFQAEHWGIDDWKKEIDWLLKKRLNIFMLRIGIDDIFQKAFPEYVDCLDDETKPDNAEGYNDRSLFWDMKYRGELRKQILQYAFERDLMHPEDCGTMTHWYSRTPKQFIDNVNPTFFRQNSASYSDKTSLVWDVREEENFQNYMKLTNTHIKEYGKAEIFHTIGFAERTYSDDKEENFRMKCFILKKLSTYLKEHYQNCPLLLCSWDFWVNYTNEEVDRLLEIMDKNQVIVFDYTSDTADEQNFTKWNVKDKFPWVFGIFHAYQPNNDIRGNYDLTEERLKIAVQDSACKGMIMWPELSHSDTFMLEYFTDNAWSPCKLNMDERIHKYCEDRYGIQSDVMYSIWCKFMPIVKLMSWSMKGSHKAHMSREHFMDVFADIHWTEKPSELYKESLFKAKEYLSDAILALDSMLEVKYQDNKMLERDLVDITKTIIGRYLHFNLEYMYQLVYKWMDGENIEELIKGTFNISEKLLNSLIKLLTVNKDYSLLYTLEKINDIHPIRQGFETTLKNNVSCHYCRSYIYENAKYLYLPEMLLLFEWLEVNIMEDNREELLHRNCFEERLNEIRTKYFDMPITNMKCNEEGCLKNVIRDVSEIMKNISFEGI